MIFSEATLDKEDWRFSPLHLSPKSILANFGPFKFFDRFVPTLVASIGESDGDSDYVESAENSPMSPSNTPDLEGHTSELDEMYEVAESELVALTAPTVLFSCIESLELPELEDSENDLLENHQDNGATPPVNTQPYPTYSPLEEALATPSAPPPHPRVEAGDTALQVRKGDLPDVRLPGADYMIYGVYQDWVHQNTGDHLDGGIAEDSKWEAWWKKIIFRPNAMTHLRGK